MVNVPLEPHGVSRGDARAAEGEAALRRDDEVVRHPEDRVGARVEETFCQAALGREVRDGRAVSRRPGRRPRIEVREERARRVHRGNARESAARAPRDPDERLGGEVEAENERAGGERLAEVRDPRRELVPPRRCRERRPLGGRRREKGPPDRGRALRRREGAQDEAAARVRHDVDARSGQEPAQVLHVVARGEADREVVERVDAAAVRGGEHVKRGRLLREVAERGGGVRERPVQEEEARSRAPRQRAADGRGDEGAPSPREGHEAERHVGGGEPAFLPCARQHAQRRPGRGPGDAQDEQRDGPGRTPARRRG